MFATGRKGWSDAVAWSALAASASTEIERRSAFWVDRSPDQAHHLVQLPHLAGIERLEDESAHGVDVTGRAGDDAHDSWFDPNRSSGQDPADIVLSALPDQAVTTALAALPVHYRTAVVLADVDGYPYKEIARITQVPIGTVMSRLSRGRKALRDALRYT